MELSTEGPSGSIELSDSGSSTSIVAQQLSTAPKVSQRIPRSPAKKLTFDIEQVEIA